MGHQLQSDQQVPPARTPDERLAPVLLAIWGLAAYVWAIDCLILHPEPAELGRRWPWTAGLVAALASILSIAVVTIAPHRLRRSMLLALCLSLVLNLTVLIGLSYVHIASRPLAARSKTSPATPPEEPPPSESFPLNLDQPDEDESPDEQRPVPTGQPELEPRELPRPARTAAAVTLLERAESLPEPQPRPSLASVTRQEVIESPPRRFEWQSKLSRQALSAEPSLGPGDAETYLVPREAMDLAPREADSPLPRQAARSPERPAMIEQPAEAPTSPPRLESPPRAAAEDFDYASTAPPVETLRRPEPRTAPPSALNPSRNALSDSRVESVPRAEDSSPAPLSPRTPQLAPRSTSPPLNREAAELAASTPRLEPPQAPPRRSAGQLPANEPQIAASAPRGAISPPSSRPSASPVELPQLSPGSGNDGRHVDDPQPAPLESPIGTRAAQAALPAGEVDATPAEMASARSIEPMAVERVASREQPELGGFAREQLAPLRSRSGAARPDLPSGVARPDVPLAAPAREAPTAGTASIDQRPAANSANLTQPEGLMSSTRTAAPDGASAPAVHLPARTAVAAGDLPAAPGSTALPLPRSTSLGDASSTATPDTSVPTIAETAAADRVENPTRGSGEPSAVVDRVPAAVADFGPAISDEHAADGSASATGQISDPSQPGHLPGRAATDLVRRASEPASDPAAARDGFDSPTARPVRSRVAVTPSVEPSVGASDIPGPPAGELADSGTPEPADVALRSTGSERVRRSTGAIPVDAAVDAGIGGLAHDIPTDIGMAHRRAQPESQHVADNVGRFIRRPLSGPPSLDTQVPIPAPAYETRMNRHGDASVGGQGRPSPRTEAAIELGLTYLAAQQQGDGSWRLQESGELVGSRQLSIESDAAASALALLSFLGAGYHHRSDKYGDVVGAGLQFLIDRQQSNGDLYIAADAASNESAWLYSHAIASIALCEAFGMTQDPALREPAQRAVDFIVESQHPQRGGWRYQPRSGSDTSVSGWMVMALRSAELANLQVPQEVWRRVDLWLDMAQASTRRPELYRYNPLAPDTISQGHGRGVTKSMTAVGLLMRMYTGWRRDDREMIDGADYLLSNLPEFGTVRDPQRDTYYWYYATQVMFHMRGRYWERWNGQLHELLTSTQEQTGEMAGSWDPWSPLPDRWSPHAGRLYVTTMNLLSLEVYYRHLPIYEDTAR